MTGWRNTYQVADISNLVGVAQRMITCSWWQGEGDLKRFGKKKGDGYGQWQLG